MLTFGPLVLSLLTLIPDSVHPAATSCHVILSGRLQTPTGQGIPQAQLQVRIDGQNVSSAEAAAPLATDEHGSFYAELPISVSGPLPRVEISAAKPGWQPPPFTAVTVQQAGQDATGQDRYQAVALITLQRQLTPAFWLATAILLGVYLAIAAGLLHRTLAALLGAALMLFLSYTAGTLSPQFFLVSFGTAMQAIDFNVIFLLLALLIFVGVLRQTGVCPWLAGHLRSTAAARPARLLAAGMVVAALLAAGWGPICALLLLLPLALELTPVLSLPPASLVLPLVLAAHLGTAASPLAGSPLGRLAASASLDWGRHLILHCGLVLACGLTVWWYFARRLQTETCHPGCPPPPSLANRPLLRRSLVVLSATGILLLLHPCLPMPPAIPALFGSMLLVAFSRVDIVALLEQDIPWSSLIFLLALFIVIAGARETGLLEALAAGVRYFAPASTPLALAALLLGSAFLCAWLETTPALLVLIPLLTSMEFAGTTPAYALALGASLGAAATPLGHPANILALDLPEKYGHPLPFPTYLRLGFPPLALCLLLAYLYLIFMVHPTKLP